MIFEFSVSNKGTSFALHHVIYLWEKPQLISSFKWGNMTMNENIFTCTVYLVFRTETIYFCTLRHFFLTCLTWHVDFSVRTITVSHSVSISGVHCPILKDALVNEHTASASVYRAGRPFAEWPSVDSAALVFVALLSDWLWSANPRPYTCWKAKVQHKTVYDFPWQQLHWNKVQCAVQAVQEWSNHSLHFHGNSGGWGSGTGLPHTSA